MIKDLESMQVIWEQDSATGRFSIDQASMSNIVNKKAVSFNRRLRMRDYLESGIGFAVAIFFAWIPFVLGNTDATAWTTHWEWFTLSAGCLFVAIAFVRQRMFAKRWLPDPTGSIKENAQRTLDGLNHQIKLLKRVVWWYCLPIEIPLLLVAMKSAAFDDIRFVYCLSSVGMMAAIVWYNHWFSVKKLQPERDEHQNLLSSMGG